ncbi:MAG TPA: homoserine O-succinyltransferase [Stellaceae bacterium]|jgi:homoserine O-succinyltransferase|nr:homoserine O-succinyltransferase [Stellaceae bacterium]
MTLMPVLSRPVVADTSHPASGGRTKLAIGVINNMPDAALRTTERQFRELLTAASGEAFDVGLRFFSLPDVPRGEAGRVHVREHHTDIAALWDDGVDGLIVTGTEPRALDLADEPYWRSFTGLVEWAQDNTASTIWSCLAAHAAVHYLDGIDRRPLGEKLSGIFACTRVADHPITAGTTPRWQVPHSRHNELPEVALIEAGYRMLSHSDDAGADLFIRDMPSRGGSLFVFLQGHPEYDGGALLREYRRDIGRFLAGECERYPAMPRNYFDDEVAAVLSELRQNAMEQQGIDLIANFPAAADKSLDFPWRAPAIRIYANWLAWLATQKSTRRRRSATGDAPTR